MAEPSIDAAGTSSPLRRRPLPARLLFGGALLAIIVVAALGSAWFAPFPPDEMHIGSRLAPPSLTYLAGTDEYGRDVLSRTLVGSQLSLILGFSATLVSLLVGVPIGLCAGYYRGLADDLMMRALDVMMSFPPLMLVLLILAVTPPSLLKTAIAIGVLFVPSVARVTRSVTLDLMTGDFITAAKARGEKTWYVLARELLPNAWPAIVVEASLRVAFAILLAPR